MLKRDAMLKLLNEELATDRFQDYCPNGLQVEGREQIRRVVTGVTACQALIDAALVEDADAILVHHGYFWKGEDARVAGIKKQRLQTLLQHDLNV
ncbi:MAG: Nif3-like dinuclear metal center hexameric protein, partial [Alcanivorax sp.]|nr:Nif3-like dinuclear metal center hexameric protein [Alcanivorax sp.]